MAPGGPPGFLGGGAGFGGALWGMLGGGSWGFSTGFWEASTVSGAGTPGPRSGIAGLADGDARVLLKTLKHEQAWRLVHQASSVSPLRG